MDPAYWRHICENTASELRQMGVKALVIGGSVGQGKADRYSDIDLFILVSSKDKGYFCVEGVRRIAKLLGDVILFRGPVFVDNFGYSFTALMRDLTVFQINLNTRDTLRPNYMGGLGSIIIYDDNGDYAKFVGKSKKLHRNINGVAESSIVFFWLRAVFIWRCIKKKQIHMASRYMVELRDQMFLIRRIRLNKLPSNPKNPIKSIEHDLGKDQLGDIYPSFPRISHHSVVRAFIYSLNWFTRETDGLDGQEDGIGELIDVGKQIQKDILEDLLGMTDKENLLQNIESDTGN